jgi:predicted RNA binding protein YcfA (HicA-like mRNA interferase family)
LRDVCLRLGWTEDRTKGDHLVMVKAGMSRPVVIKMVRDLGDDLLSSCCRTMGITRKTLDARLNEIRGHKKATRGGKSK